MKILIDIPNEVFDWFKNGFPDEKDGEVWRKVVGNTI